MITVLVESSELSAGEATVTGAGYRHLFRARRVAAGTRVRAADGAGGARWATVAEVGRRSARLTIGEPAPTGEPDWHLELLVAAPRRERASWLVEKATEVGAGAVRFLASERAPREYGPGTLDRFRRVATAALEQCHRSRLPAISGIHPWGELGRMAAGAAARWFLDLDPESLPAGALSRPPAGSSAAVAVGPEGGWTEAERRELSGLGFVGVGLGERVLRVETAALAAAVWLLTSGEQGI